MCCTAAILPRVLIGKVQRLIPDATVRDERLLVRPVDMGFHAVAERLLKLRLLLCRRFRTGPADDAHAWCGESDGG